MATPPPSDRPISVARSWPNRRAVRIDGAITMHDRSVHELSAPLLLVPLERALSSLSWAMVALALALLAARVF